MLRKLDDLVEDLIPECSTPFFGKKAIRKHAIDTLHERRRQIRLGHDYEKVATCSSTCITNKHMYMCL